MTLLGSSCATNHSHLRSQQAQTRGLSSVIWQPHYNGSTYLPYMGDLMAGHGNPANDNDSASWAKMGLRFSRIPVYPVDGADLQDMVNRNWINDMANIDKQVQYNNSVGVTTLLLLGFTPKYNANVVGDDKSMPKDINEWQGFVGAVVDRYSKMGVKFYQVWNEAAGEILSAKQSPFWHGPAGPNGTYASAREDYVNKIHIPAAAIIRRAGAYVVYGGWPCESSPGDYISWLEWRSPDLQRYNMLDWIDYLDMHYYKVDDLKGIYEHGFEGGSTPYSSYGAVKGIWQTEFGHDGLRNFYSGPIYYFNYAIFALEHNWSDPNKFVSFVYAVSGDAPYNLLDWNGGIKTPGQALAALVQHTGYAPLSKFKYGINYGAGGGGAAIKVGDNLVIQYQGDPGSRSLSIPGLPVPRNYQVYIKDGLSGMDIADISQKSWDGNGLNLTFNMPGMDTTVPDESGKSYPIDKLVYIVIVPTW
jgi:hypothetical protein